MLVSTCWSQYFVCLFWNNRILFLFDGLPFSSFWESLKFCCYYCCHGQTEKWLNKSKLYKIFETQTFKSMKLQTLNIKRKYIHTHNYCSSSVYSSIPSSPLIKTDDSLLFPQILEINCFYSPHSQKKYSTQVASTQHKF